MLQINDNDKKRVYQFIEDNDLDYSVVDNNISKFGVVAEDSMLFNIYNYNNEYQLVKYNKEKDQVGNPGLMPYEYFYYKTLSQLLEQLSSYDKSLEKRYWETTLNSAEVPFNEKTYNDDWVSDFLDTNWKTDKTDRYQYLVYESFEYKPELLSPHNTLHQVGISNYQYPVQTTKVEKLYFEIHPISCENKREKYFLQLACNNEPVLKEYINYNIVKKKGLKLFLNTMFQSMEKFKVS
jgi:hypothetical protein